MNNYYSKKIAGLLFVVLVLQSYLLDNTLIFSSGEYFQIDYTQFGIFLLSYSFILFFFMDAFETFKHSSDIYRVIRRNKRSSTFFQIILKQLTIISLIVIIQFILALLINYELLSKLLLSTDFLLFLILYVVTLYNMLLLFGVFSLVKNKEFSMYASIFYLLFSIITMSWVIEKKPELHNIIYFLIPNFLMFNRSTSNENYGFDIIFSLVQSVIICFVLLTSIYQLSKKRDLL